MENYVDYLGIIAYNIETIKKLHEKVRMPRAPVLRSSATAEGGEARGS
jgi:hypothetical protein